jgi:hypothetical protein
LGDESNEGLSEFERASEVWRRFCGRFRERVPRPMLVVFPNWPAGRFTLHAPLPAS